MLQLPMGGEGAFNRQSAGWFARAEVESGKIGQGAKSGMGGHLLSHKVTAEVARVRNIPEGTSALSPARHMELLDLRI